MIDAIKQACHRVKESVKVKRAGHAAEHFFHMAYLGLVYIEGHSYYAKTAAVLFVIVAINLVLHIGEHE